MAQLLLVEDDAAIRHALVRALNERGHAVSSTGTALEALEQVVAAPPDLVILDLGLPGLDGFGVARRLRQNPATARANLVAITGYSSEEMRRRAYESGFEHFLTKPADPAELERLLAALPGP